ncbi:hypothetical protein J2S43_002319 [Catenuloplanes nepalensis]|uniref:Uncharacterized protein n=1 Tax=Catenuloplanes nepalensis TaxID=587533 RepID=A0ABT9MQV5_9ACTN|nr:hypothetical protein [Catenuloplanes nepalensis]MDP9793807.1 hypothetical protein [Catenuloplanes nepalensis]
MVTPATEGPRGTDSADATDRLRRELPNVRAAITHGLRHAPAAYCVPPRH